MDNIDEVVDYVVYECVTLGEYDVRCDMLDEHGQACEWVGHGRHGRSSAEAVLAFHRGQWRHARPEPEKK